MVCSSGVAIQVATAHRAGGRRLGQIGQADRNVLRPTAFRSEALDVHGTHGKGFTPGAAHVHQRSTEGEVVSTVVGEDRCDADRASVLSPAIEVWASRAAAVCIWTASMIEFWASRA